MLGDLLLKLRKRLPHYQKASHFASVLGCTREHYRRIETGQNHPSKALLTKIIRELEVNQQQADCLWVAWSLYMLPDNVKEGLVVLQRKRLAAAIARAVTEDLILVYDIDEEDEADLKKIINDTISKEELLWRS